MMDPLPMMAPTAPPGYHPVQYSQQSQDRVKHSQALTGCGIALIVVSCINWIVWIIATCIHLNTTFAPIMAAASVFDVFFLLLGKLIVYGSYNTVEREQTLVVGMILGITIMIVKGPQIIIGFIATGMSQHFSILFLFGTIMMMANISLTLAISIIICKKTCACCNKGNPTFYNQEAKYPQEMQSFATNAV